jgi:histidinol dehydrogenase
VDLDMVAGPSEIMIISDGKTDPVFVAADLISQAEHDEMALSILVTSSEAFAGKVKDELERQLLTLKKERIARKSLRQRGAILIVKDLHQAIKLANRIAPEHLELSVENPLPLAKSVRHAGAVFLGLHTPEAIGDYLAGPNHILPTAGTARYASALGVEDFQKKINLMQFSKKSLRRFEGDVKRFAEWEGLEGHYRSVQVRMRG